MSGSSCGSIVFLVSLFAGQSSVSGGVCLALSLRARLEWLACAEVFFFCVCVCLCVFVSACVFYIIIVAQSGTSPVLICGGVCAGAQVSSNGIGLSRKGPKERSQASMGSFLSSM